MSMFSNWLAKRLLKEDEGFGGDPTSKFQFNGSDDDFADDYDKCLEDLIKTVLRKYPEETFDFLNTIGGRGDSEVAVLVQKLQRGQGPRLAVKPKHPEEQDEVVPAAADKGHNPNQGE